MRKKETEPESEARSLHEARRIRQSDIERRSRKDRRHQRAKGLR